MNRLRTGSRKGPMHARTIVLLAMAIWAWTGTMLFAALQAGEEQNVAVPQQLEGEARDAAVLLIRQLANPDFELRQQASRELWKIGPPALELLQGAVDGGTIAEDDEIEYTIYFRNLGNTDAESVRICDRIQPFQSVLLGSFTGGYDFEIEIGDSSAQGLTASNDTADRARLLPAGAAIPSDCNITGNNTNGVIVIDVTGTTGIPNLTALPQLGSPDDSFGPIRIRTKITPE